MSKHFLPALLPGDESRQCCKHRGAPLPQSRAVSGQHCAHRAQTSRAGPGLGRHGGGGLGQGLAAWECTNRWEELRQMLRGQAHPRAGRSPASCTGRESGAHAQDTSVPAPGAGPPAAHAQAVGSPPAPRPPTDAKPQPTQQARKTPTEDSATPPAKPRAGRRLQTTLSAQQRWKVKTTGHLRKTKSKEERQNKKQKGTEGTQVL